MIKGLYITSYDLKDKYNGVSKKINYQIECMRTNGFYVEILDYNSIPKSLITKTGLFIERLLGYSYRLNYLINSFLLKSDKELCDTDFLYIRKDFCNNNQIYYLNKIRKQNPKLKILVEYPTFPYDNEIHGRRKIITLPIDKECRKKLKKSINRAVTFSDDSLLFGVKCLNISNAIDYNKVTLKNHKNHSGINLIAVALFDRFHGYDRLIKAMGENIDIVKTNNICFHLVGDGYAIKEYKSLISTYNLESFVILHGKMFGQDLDEIYNISDIAVDNMGRHRVGCYYNSSLKGKEYGAKGLPIVSGVKTELDNLDEDFYYRVPADDSLIDLNEIIKFYHKMYDNKDPILIAKHIRETTNKYFNFEVAFKPVIDYIKE